MGAAACVCASSFTAQSARAETMFSALARAYDGNPDLNQQRANVRARDEDAPKAAAGMRPKASASLNGGPQNSRIRLPAGRDPLGRRSFSTDQFLGEPRGAIFNLTQTLYDGGRTGNLVRQAESGVFAARATMRLAEQTTLQNGATAYMNVLRDTAVLALRKNNIAVLEQQLRQTRDRFDVGEVTRTDVAQSEASLAQARSEFYAARALLETSVANFRQITGIEPTRLEPAQSIEKLLPKSLAEAIDIAMVEHPGVVAALHQADAAELAVKVAEGALLPTVAVSGQVSQQYDSFLGSPGTRQFSAQAIGTANFPIYQGGAEYASIRQAKEQAGQARLNADLQRDLARVGVVSSFAQLETAKASIVSGQAAARAAEIALQGVREEAKVGQRTTLDVLNARHALLNARVNLIVAQRDRIVASYAALASIGRLSAAELGLDVATYDPTVHFEQVRDNWIGVDTPGGR
ncbi:MAG: TolC family outer membrane protein [Methylocystis sp.]|nr:TolC family outer membrane protein [Methylocystis sp.]